MKHWIDAARVRTLPLSISGILVGSFYAMSQSYFNWKIIGVALLTTLGLQVLSNFANDYGDGVKGTDNQDRIGPKRAVQSGVISAKQMKKAVIITAILTFISAVMLIYVSFKDQYLYYSLFFLLVCISAIIAAIKYTVGEKAYGYYGYGDLLVFIFFGLVSTLGTYFLIAKTIDWELVLPATAIGLLSVAVLNLNNMRDEASDKKSGKNTIVVKIGGEKARQYHYFLVFTAMLLTICFGLVKDFELDQYIFIAAFFPIASHLLRVKKIKEAKDLDPELKKLALSTFLLSILISLSLIYFISDLIV